MFSENLADSFDTGSLLASQLSSLVDDRFADQTVTRALATPPHKAHTYCRRVVRAKMQRIWSARCVYECYREVGRTTKAITDN
jgi:hypothetical protein